MSSVSQTIPNYIFGINEQPDYLKRPGQVRDSLNMTPDVTKGLIKRPGSRFICNVEDDIDGKWFNYYRTETEQYIGHIQANGFVRVWNADGTVCTVTQLVTTNTVTTVDTISAADGSRTAGTYTIGENSYTTDSTSGHGATFEIVINGSGAATVTITNGGSNYAVNDTFTIADAQLGGGGGAALTFDVATVSSPTTTNTSTHGNYLTNTAAEDLQTLTVNDYTFVCNRNRTVRYNSTLSTTPPNEGVIELKVIAYGRNYTVDFKNTSGTTLFSATINTTADSTIVIDSDAILNDLVNDINGQSSAGFAATRIGNTIHVRNTTQSFTMETSDVTLLSVFTDQVNNVERLPYQCHHGYVTKIVNSNSEEDDYYAVFQGKDDQDGSGVWQETVGWNRNVNASGVFQNYTGINTTLDHTTMPHVLICTNLNTFTVAAADGATPNARDAMSYSTRAVGDLGTNPDPSFVDATINQMLLFRNRIAFLSGENVVMTTSGGLKPVNFFSTSALTSLATDPIDVSAASKEPALLWDGVEINSGLLLFAENQQYLMTTDSDLLTQETTKLNAISYYPYSRRCSPFSLGTTVAFIDNSGSNARMFEMSNISRDTEPTVIEQSKPISRLTPSTVIDISDSRESSLVLLSSSNSNELFGYKYFQDGPERQLSSWFKWQLTGTVIYHCIMRDKYYTVVRYKNHNRLLVMDLQDTMDTAFVSFDDNEYQVHLDNRVTVAHADITYNGATDTSTFTMPQNASENVLDTSHKDVYAYVTTAGDNLGRFAQVSFNGNNGSLTGDWSSQDIQLGYLFESSVTVPQFYVTRPEGNSVRANTRSNTVIHRLYLETGAIGTCHYTLTRTGKDNFTGHIDGITFDQYDANDPLLSESLRTYIPVYERNTNVVLRIHAEHPSPLSLFSISWEGDVSNRYYQSV